MKTTRYAQTANRIMNLINNGVFKPGDKIPSIRRLARELKVSVNTVKEAYWRLENLNYIVAVPQSGFYVKKQLPSAARPAPLDPRRLDPQEVSLCRIYGAFQHTGRYSPEAGLGIAALNPELWPTERMQRFFQEALRGHEYESYSYMMPPGYRELCEQIARHGMAGGLNLSAEDIIVTNGCHEAVYLALTALCKPGDAVVFESPIYFNLLHLLARLDLKIIEIPSRRGEGINLDTLRFVIENYSVKAVFSISNFNNPLGFCMSGEKKRHLVRLLNDCRIPLIEDDIYGDLGFEERPDTCKSYDTDGNVLLCSSFSKTIAPGLRVGWIAPGRYYDQIIEMKTLLNISTASMNQIAAAGFLKEGGYDRHLRHLRKTLQQQVFQLRAAVLRHFPEGATVTNPRGGFLLWVELPKSVDAFALYQDALKKNILIAPGNLFTMKGKYSNCLRLNAGNWNDRIEKAVKFLGRLCAERLGPESEETAHKDPARPETAVVC